MSVQDTKILSQSIQFCVIKYCCNAQFMQAADAAENRSNVGVFFCGPKVLAAELRSHLPHVARAIKKADGRDINISFHEGESSPRMASARW